MNTTSRLENATRELQRSFLASADALNYIEGKENYAITDLGQQSLRGRLASMRVYAVEKRAEAAKSAVPP
jgi:class 3 adenylate cyclase